MLLRWAATRSKTLTGSTMAEVVLDANIIIAQSDRSDALHARAIDLVARLERDGHRPLLIDVLVAEAISVLCGRARERKANPPGARSDPRWLSAHR